MVSIYDVEATELIEKTAEQLKAIEHIKPPAWAIYVKTGTHKERPPVREDWWYVRAAAVLRSVDKLGPVGVAKLRTKYGGRKNRGVKPEKFFKGSGNIIRTILQQLEKAELVQQKEISGHKGRIVAPKGKSLLHKTVAQMTKGDFSKATAKATGKKKEEKPKAVKEGKPAEKAAEKPQAEKKEVQEKQPKSEKKAKDKKDE